VVTDVSVAQEQLQTRTVASMHATSPHQGGSHVVVNVADVELSVAVGEVDEEALALVLVSEPVTEVAVVAVIVAMVKVALKLVTVP